MALNIAGVFQGIGSGGSEYIDSRQDQADYIEKLKVQEGIKIAEEGRAKVTANAARRAAEKKAILERAENLALYYTPEQVRDIMGGGKARVEYAIRYAEDLPSGQLASKNYRMASTSRELPTLGEENVEQSPSMEDPFVSRFKPNNAAIRKYEGLYGSRLAQNTTFMTEAVRDNNQDKIAAIAKERTDLLAGLAEYEKEKAKVDDVPNTDIYAGTNVQSTALDTVVKGTKSSALMNSDAVEIDSDTKRYIRKAGSTGIGHSAQIAALNILRQSEGKYSERLTSRIDLEIANLVKGLRADGGSIINKTPQSITNSYDSKFDFFNAVSNGTIKQGTIARVGDNYFYYVGSPVEAYTQDDPNSTDLQDFIALN